MVVGIDKFIFLHEDKGYGKQDMKAIYDNLV
jgi:hypothetical protein